MKATEGLPKIRHLEEYDRNRLTDLAERCGYAEILRSLAIQIGNAHPEWDTGESIRRALLRVAIEAERAFNEKSRRH